MSVEVTVAAPEVHTLGEGPVWDARGERVLWVDILAGTVHSGRLDGDRVLRTGSQRVDRYAGAVVHTDGGDLLVAGERGLIVLTADGRRLDGPAILPEGTGRRLNDGGCDPAGVFLVGSLALDDSPGGQCLVRAERDGTTVTVLDDDLSLSNGLAWSPDGGTLYSLDSVPGVLYRRAYDAGSGATGPRTPVIEFTDGTPDGMCADAEGYLWIAMWGAGQVRRYSPDGRLVVAVDLPVPHVTCPAFVGPGLDRLLVTTATKDMTPGQLARHPHAGKLFLADVGVPGLPVPSWAGFDNSGSTL